MARVILSKNFDPNNVVFANKTTPMNEAETIKSCRIQYKYPEETIGNTKYPEEVSRLIMQSAKMKLPGAFGISNAEAYGNPDKWSVNMSFRGEDKKKTIANFKEAYVSLDERVIKEGINRPDEVGGGHVFDEDDDDVMKKKLIRKGYKSRLRKAKNTADTDFSDTMRLDIPWDKEKKQPRDYVQFYDENNERIDWSTVYDSRNGSEIVCLFEISQVWSSTSNNTFGVTAKLIQMKMFRSASTGKVNGFQIQTETEPDDEVESNGDSIDQDAEEVEVEVEVDDIDDVSD